MRGRWLVCCGLLACGGRSEEQEAAPSGSAGSAAAGSGGSAGASMAGAGGVSAAGSAGTSSGGAALVIDCVDAPPEAPSGPFASPEVVWERISRFVSGELKDPPSPLPAETSAEWSGEIALAAFDRDRQGGEAPAGLRRFITSWTGLASQPEVALERDWAALAAEDGATLAHLLTLEDDAEPARAGLFTDRAWLSAFPRIGPRGARLFEALQGEMPAPPPDAHSEPLVPQPGQPRREAYEEAIADPVCRGCHVMMDPYGFSLEHFDELGEYREVDSGKLVDASGSLTLDDGDVSFTSVVELAPALAESCQAGRVFSERFLADALVASGRLEPGEVQPPEVDALRIAGAFFAGERTVRSLVSGAAQSEAILR